ncbi:MAG: hypothetical protein DWQ10_13385 [Calditrichaeota bacterium]|nr:MAG: hypothetical protein DWQ10_13385 [Calditrichota bacterium]
MRSNKLAVFVLIFAFTLPMLLQAGSRIYVKIKPPTRKVVVVKPRKPHTNSVWVSGRWQWNGRKYVWHKGHWVSPRKGFVWIDGHWVKNRKGWYWIGGHWKSK